NLVRVDLTPLRETLDEINSKLTRIEQRLEDHERRIRRLEDGARPVGQKKGEEPSPDSDR
ncbi:MAG: hypothetical protein AB1631_31455, partial [Acidobacteriota bacterium]